MGRDRHGTPAELASARSTAMRPWPGSSVRGARRRRRSERIAAAAALPAGEIDADVGAFVQLVAAELAIDAGQSERALDAVMAGLAHLETSDDTVLVGPLCAAGLRAAADRAERARARRRPDDIEAAERAGAAARARADAIWSAAPPAPGSASATRTTCEAEWGRLNGNTDAALWMAAADEWAAIPSPYPAAYARFRAAEAHLVAGDRAAAEAALRDAVSGGTRIWVRDRSWRSSMGSPSGRASPWTPEMPRHRARRLPGPPSRPRKPTPFAELGLSAREAEVLALVALGRTNGQIATSCSSAPRRPASTSPTSSTSWASAAASRRRCSPPGPG